LSKLFHPGSSSVLSSGDLGTVTGEFAISVAELVTEDERFATLPGENADTSKRARWKE
jgi:hypothetical protein